VGGPAPLALADRPLVEFADVVDGLFTSRGTNHAILSMGRFALGFADAVSDAPDRDNSMVCYES